MTMCDNAPMPWMDSVDGDEWRRAMFPVVRSSVFITLPYRSNYIISTSILSHGIRLGSILYRW